MPHTFTSLLTMTRDRLDEATARQWTDVQLRRWLNDGCKDLARKTEYLTERDTVAAVVSTREYSLDANILRVHRVEFTATGDSSTYPLEYVDVMNMDAFGWSARTLTSSHPYLYTIWGSIPNLKLIVHPGPSIAGNFVVYHYRLPTALATDGTADASSPEIPDGWDDLLVDYCEFRALRRDRDPRWTEAKAIYDENVTVMFEATRRWTDQAGMIVPGGSFGHLPSWLVAGE